MKKEQRSQLLGGRGLCELEASLVYIENSRPANVIRSHLKNKTKKRKSQKTTHKLYILKIYIVSILISGYILSFVIVAVFFGTRFLCVALVVLELQLRGPPASAPAVLGLKIWTNTSS